MWNSPLRKKINVPLFPHKGAFAATRKYHMHEGVDLYADDGEQVFAVEDSIIVKIENFTGLNANPPSPWWEDTMAVLAEGASGVVVYGEIDPLWTLSERSILRRGDLVGFVKRVLRVDKGLPMSMLHLELHVHGTTSTCEWKRGEYPPETLRDPTYFLIESSK